MKKQTFLQGSLLLAFSAVFAKICGALFKLPLTALLGGTGMGYFSCAYGLFLPIYAVLVTGLSTAVARPVAEFTAQGKFSSSKKILRIARRVCFFMGLFGMGIAFLSAKWFAERTAGTLEAFPAVAIMAPAIFFCCLTAVERGFYEGMCSMTQTAISQSVEAFGKLCAGLFFCDLFMKKNFFPMYSKESQGAFGAVLGVTISTIAGWVYLWGSHAKLQEKHSPEELPSGREILALLVKMMIPVSLGALVTNLTSCIDLFTMMNDFQRMIAENAENFYEKSHLSRIIPETNAAAFVYGSFMGLSVTVFNLVPSLTNMFAKSVLPCTAQAFSKGEMKQAADYARQVILFTGMIAIPAGCGIFALSEEILNFLFSGRTEEIQAAVSGLRWLSPAVIALCFVFPIFSLFQAVGKQFLPVKLMLLGIFVKFAGNIFLIPECSTSGSAMATSLCYWVICLPAFYFLKKIFPIRLPWKELFFQLWGGVLCACSAWVSCDFLKNYLPEKISFLCAVGIGVCVYGMVLYLTGQKEIFQSVRANA